MKPNLIPMLSSYRRRSSHSLPSTGLLHRWKFDEGAGQVIADYASGSASVRTNFFGADITRSAVVDQTYGYWAKNAGPITLTANYSANPNGDVIATRFELAALTNGSLYFNEGTVLPAGTYTLSLWVKSNTGIAQAFRMSPDNTGTLSADKVVPATGWTQFTHTFTASGTNICHPIVHNTARTAIDVSIWGARLEAGGAATPGLTPDGSMVVGRTMAANATYDAVWTGGGLATLADPRTFMGQLPLTTLTAASIYIAAKKAGAANTFDHLLGTPYAESSGFHIYTSFGGGPPQVNFKDAEVLCWGSSNADTSVRIYGLHYDTTSIWMTVDGQEVGRATAAGKTAIFDLIQSGNLVGYRADATSYYAAMYNVAHNQSETLAVVDALKAELAPRSVSVDRLQKALFWEGDSLTDPTTNGGLTGFPYLVLNTITPRGHGKNYGTSGASLTQLAARSAAVKAQLSAFPRAKTIIHVGIGTNDLDGGNAATFVAALKAQCLEYKSTGALVVVRTVPPRTTSGFNTIRNAANTLIRADTSFYDALADLDTDPAIGADAAASDTTYYEADGTHWKAAGHTKVAVISKAAILTLW